jgi:hypothetical protein
MYVHYDIKWQTTIYTILNESILEDDGLLGWCDRPDDSGSRHLWNVVKLPDFMEQQPVSQPYSYSPPSELHFNNTLTSTSNTNFPYERLPSTDAPTRTTKTHRTHQKYTEWQLFSSPTENIPSCDTGLTKATAACLTSMWVLCEDFYVRPLLLFTNAYVYSPTMNINIQICWERYLNPRLLYRSQTAILTEIAYTTINTAAVIYTYSYLQ